MKSQFAERFLPFEFEAAGATRRCLDRQRDAALRALRLATCPLHCETPLDQRTVVISLDPLGGGEDPVMACGASATGTARATASSICTAPTVGQ